MGKTTNHKKLEMSGNIVDMIYSNEKHAYSKCCIADIKPENNTNFEKYNKFCWVHGGHYFVTGGQFYITVFTYFNTLKESKKYEPFGTEKVTDVWRMKEDKIRITEHATGKEYEFVVPRELVLSVQEMLIDQPLWIRYVIRKGLSTSLAFHLNERAKIWKDTQARIDQAWKTYDSRHDEIYWTYDSKAKCLIENPAYTKTQKDILNIICYEEMRKNIRNIYISHRFKIDSQNEELSKTKVVDMMRGK